MTTGTLRDVSLVMLAIVVPTMLATLTACVRSDELAPRRSAASAVKPLDIQVVSLDWKWLFIYPDEGVATVNELAIPVGRPVRFDLTASGATNRFFVPQLAGPAYARRGTVTHGELQANRQGTYCGFSPDHAGTGCPDMPFVVNALAAEEFAEWVKAAKTASQVLDAAAYADLTTPSADVPPFRFRAVTANPFHAMDPNAIQTIR